MTVQQRMKDAHGDSDGVGDLAIQFSVHIRILQVPRRFRRPFAVRMVTANAGQAPTSAPAVVL